MRGEGERQEGVAMGGSGGLETAWDRPEPTLSLPPPRGDPFPTPPELTSTHRAPTRTGCQHRLLISRKFSRELSLRPVTCHLMALLPPGGCNVFKDLGGLPAVDVVVLVAAVIDDQRNETTIKGSPYFFPAPQGSGIGRGKKIGWIVRF